MAAGVEPGLDLDPPFDPEFAPGLDPEHIPELNPELDPPPSLLTSSASFASRTHEGEVYAARQCRKSACLDRA